MFGIAGSGGGGGGGGGLVITSVDFPLEFSAGVLSVACSSDTQAGVSERANATETFQGAATGGSGCPLYTSPANLFQTDGMGGYRMLIGNDVSPVNNIWAPSGLTMADPPSALSCIIQGTTVTSAMAAAVEGTTLGMTASSAYVTGSGAGARGGDLEFTTGTSGFDGGVGNFDGGDFNITLGAGAGAGTLGTDYRPGSLNVGGTPAAVAQSGTVYISAQSAAVAALSINGTVTGATGQAPIIRLMNQTTPVMEFWIGGDTYTGSQNCFVGVNAGKAATDVVRSTLVGYGAGDAITGTGSQRATAFGYNALGAAINGATACVAVGARALEDCNAIFNTGVGDQAGADVTSGTLNAFFGYGSGVGVVAGTGNVAIGGGALFGADASNAILVGSTLTARTGSTMIACNITSTTSNDFMCSSIETGISRGAAGIINILGASNSGGTAVNRTASAIAMGASGLITGNAVSAPTFSSGSVTSNVATINTTAAHNLVSGQIVTISGSAGVAVNGSYIITVVDFNTFTFAKTVGDGTITAATITPEATVQFGAAPTTPSAIADVMMSCSATSQIACVFQAKSGQSANIVNFVTSADVVTSSINSSGKYNTPVDTVCWQDTPGNNDLFIGGSSNGMFYRTTSNFTAGLDTGNTGTAFFFQVKKGVSTFAGGTPLLEVTTTSNICANSGGQFAWASVATNPLGASLDTGLTRLAAGQVRVGNGTTGSGSLAIGTSSAAIGTSGVGVLGIENGTAPSSSPANMLQLYANDSAANNANLFARNEAGFLAQLTGLDATLASDYTNATTTPSNVSMTINLLTTVTYSFMITLFVEESTAADGVLIDFDGGTVTASNFRAVTLGVDGAAVTTLSTTTALATDATIATYTNPGIITVYGTITTSNSGTFIMRAAQNTHTTGTLTFRAGSNMKFWRGG